MIYDAFLGKPREEVCSLIDALDKAGSTSEKHQHALNLYETALNLPFNPLLYRLIADAFEKMKRPGLVNEMRDNLITTFPNHSLMLRITLPRKSTKYDIGVGSDISDIL